MTDEQIIKALECCQITNCKDCVYCGCDEYRLCVENLLKDTLNLINRQHAEVEELNELYTNLKNATVQHSIDNEKDRQLLGEYQNIFLDLGYALEEVSDPELKEIKAWKDRMLWHCKRADKLLTENNELKAEIEELKETNKKYSRALLSNRRSIKDDYEYLKRVRAEAIKEFADKVKEKAVDIGICDAQGNSFGGATVAFVGDIDNLVKEMVGGTKD